MSNLLFLMSDEYISSVFCESSVNISLFWFHTTLPTYTLNLRVLNVVALIYSSFNRFIVSLVLNIV